jgi:putative copper export protein
MRGVRLPDFLQTDWLTSAFGRIVLLKLSLFAVILAVSAIHDFAVGPRAASALEQDPQSAIAQSLRRRASLLGRLNVLLGLVAIFVGVMIVRGLPGV